MPVLQLWFFLIVTQRINRRYTKIIFDVESPWFLSFIISFEMLSSRFQLRYQGIAIVRVVYAVYHFQPVFFGECFIPFQNNGFSWFHVNHPK
jgi:hypothetical protein